jgi:two-component system, OmpR family, sensor kinase
MRSLRTTLLLTLLAAVTAVTLTAAFLVHRLAHQEIDAILDYHLRQIALSLRDDAHPRGRADLAVNDTDPEFEFVVQIESRDGISVYPARARVRLPEVSRLGFVTVRGPTEDWRVYSTRRSGRLIQVGQPLRIRERLAFRAASHTLAVVLLALPVLSVLVWRLVGRALRPLDRLANSVLTRTPAALEPFPEEGTVREALPLVRALNDLLARLDASLAGQRAFIADAAHQLRTPLAVLELQAQLAHRARDDAERTATLADLRVAIDRTAHVVHQILTLAREEPEAAGARHLEPLGLAEIVTQVVAEHLPVAEARSIDLGALHVVDAAVLGEPMAMRIMLANLVSNAIRYTPRAGRVDVTTGARGDRTYLEVADNGPGIPESERERVFDRFYRLSPSSSGSGLGLAIVKSIVDRHRGRVTLHDTPGGGLTVRVELPAARQPTVAATQRAPTPRVDASSLSLS